MKLLKDMATPDFSIVVPLYNKISEISRCLHSALTQTYENFELIVIDDGSTDGGDVVVRSFQDRRLRFLQQENRGVAETRNIGVQAAKAPVIVFLDADDEWLPTHLEELARLVRLHPEAGIYSSGFWLDRGQGWRRRVRLAPHYLKPKSSLINDYFSIPDGKTTLPSAFAVRKEALIAAGGYRTMFGEDIDLLVRMAAMFPVAYTSKTTAIWHLSAGNRRCVAEAEEVKLHAPGSLLPSLRRIESMDHIPSKTRRKARDYVAARERKAVFDTLLHGHRQHAAYLYDVWKREYKKQSIATVLIFVVPDLALKVLGRCVEFLRRAKSVAQYAMEQPESRKVFGPSL
jgi:glycosyltransferase involved in cell wall biosynthesis